ncbi:polygalacturonase [Argentina anserina]|uniref:polygalacturonase n=1 Tax=Argentina anserina TaxID=57926 RepID=UPI0021766A6F|nr:polygalacturonase [Potentilla anserina]
MQLSSQSNFLSLLLLIIAPTYFSFPLGHNPQEPPVLDHHHHQTHTGHNLSRPNPGILWTSRRELVTASSSAKAVYNVHDFGAKGNGGDDTKAFRKAWKKACSNSRARSVELVVPKNRLYHLKPITFSGPCKSHVTFKIYGTIKASPFLSHYKRDRRHWIQFENLTNFRVEGASTGIINGNGRKWWESSCKVNESLPCTDAPTAVTFYECKNLEVANLRFRNAQRMHLSFQRCVLVKVLNLIIIAPENSPNTDGIHVTETQDIRINSCRIRTGDDCISIVSGSKNVQASDITCGPGHGISIGSLGAGNSEAEVSDVVVTRAKLVGTTNGLRIKTWQGGSGYAKNIRFKNVLMHNVTNPIIIDQHYCDQETPCHDQASAVKISGVAYQNVKGTSASKVAVKFDCNKRFGCQKILVQDVNIVPLNDEGMATASCQNVGLRHIGIVSPKCSST